MTTEYKSGRLAGNVIPVTTLTATSNTLSDSSTLPRFPYDTLLCDTTLGEQTVVLPSAASYPNLRLRFKKISTDGAAVILDGASSEPIDGATTQCLVKPYDFVDIVSSGSATTGWYALNKDWGQPQLLSRTLVLLTAVAQTTLFTVPTGKTLKVTEVRIHGDTAQSGGTSSKLLIGTTGGSYAELLNGSTGHTFISGTATSLLATTGGVDGADLLAPATMSVVNTVSFAAGSVIKADVSGTVCTAGKVYVLLYGFLV